MKYLILFLLISLSGLLNAQTLDTAPWCPPGATWIYRISSQSSIDYFKITYEKDTFISGQAVKKLQVSQISFYSLFPPMGRIENLVSNEYEYLSNDSLYYYDRNDNVFKLKYNFSAVNGDSLVINKYRFSCPYVTNFPESDSIALSNIYTDTFNNVIYSIFQYDDFNSAYQFGNIIKNIGPFIAFDPIVNTFLCQDSTIICGLLPQYEGLVYYGDSIRGVVISNSYNPFEIILETNKLSDQNAEHLNFNLFPNPATDVLHLTSNISQKFTAFKIFSIDGSLVKSGNLNNNSIEINDLSKNEYFLILYNKNNAYCHFKFIKT